MVNFLPNRNSNDVVSRYTYSLTHDTTSLDKSKWIIPNHKEFDGIKVPQDCSDAIDKLSKWAKENKTQRKVLNMSELTPLANIMQYDIESGTPLWYHLNVAMFDRELKIFERRVKNDYYDLVIFEEIPHLNNFYPLTLKGVLDEHYDLWFSFQAPRELTSEVIFVYTRK